MKKVSASWLTSLFESVYLYSVFHTAHCQNVCVFRGQSSKSDLRGYASCPAPPLKWHILPCFLSPGQPVFTVKASVCSLILGCSRLWNRVKWFDLTSNTLLLQGLRNRPLLVQKTLKETKWGWKMIFFFCFLFLAKQQIFISLLHIDLFLFIYKRYNLQSNGSVGCSLLCSGQSGHNDEGRGGPNAKQEINTSGK